MGDTCGVLGCFAGAEMQCLETPMGKPRVECGRDGADGILEEGKSVADFGRVECGCAHDDVGMAVDVLGHRVHDNVGAMVEWILHVGRQEGVVDHDENTMLMGYSSHLPDVHERECGVRGRLDPDQFRLFSDQVCDIVADVRRERDMDIVGEGDFGEVAVRAAVDVGYGDDV
jgi:hypothetical protein